MKSVIRRFRAEDAPATAELVSEVIPFMITTPLTVLRQVESAPAAQHFRVLVAERYGAVVGTARAGLFSDSSEPGPAFANVNVAAAHRRFGIGGALLRAAEEHLRSVGATTVHAWALEERPALGFAERHGYSMGRTAEFLRLGLSGVPGHAAAEVPSGIRLTDATEFAHDPRPLYEAEAECIADEPRDHDSDLIGYEDWLALHWDRPDLDRELSTVAMADGRVAAFTFAQTDGRRRYFSGGTGTRREFRGRGLARAVKLDSLARARRAGYTDAFTNNATGNAPMLAVNEWLGYRVAATERRCTRELDASPAS